MALSDNSLQLISAGTVETDEIGDCPSVNTVRELELRTAESLPSPVHTASSEGNRGEDSEPSANGAGLVSSAENPAGLEQVLLEVVSIVSGKIASGFTGD
jgi:hypothetical protein